MPPKNGKKVPVAVRVWELAQPLAEELGLSLWDVQYVKEGADWYLRIFIDKEGGVSIDDCVDMTHAIDPVLDEEDPVPQEYMLEVSSPGIERRLVRREHFAYFVGEPVLVRLIRPMEGIGREFAGLLMESDFDTELSFTLEDGSTLTVPRKDCSAVTSIEVEEEYEEEEETED